MNSNLQDKLHEFSAAPPDGLWTKIADALDENENYAQRLFDYEEQPPANAWPSIESSLNDAVPAKVIPFTKRWKLPLRYIAVASLITVFLVTVTLTVRRTKAGDLEAENLSSTKNNSVQPAKQPTVKLTQTAAEEPVRNNPSFNPVEAGETTSRSLTATTTPAIEKEGNTPSNRYLVLNGDDGKLVKVPKKLASLIHCKDGDSECLQRLQKLRQTMADNAMSADFTGILEMLRQLQQKP